MLATNPMTVSESTKTASPYIYLARRATDMRKGFDGLYGLVRDRLLSDPLSGHYSPSSSGLAERAQGRILM
jgi:hypothetical protein